MRALLPTLTVFLVLSGIACGGGEEPESAPVIVQPAEGGDSEGSAGEGAETPAGPELVIGDAPCETDADCAPAACCHAAACVGVGDAPDCAETMCTMDCREGTMDCGGGCLCHEGRCAARLMGAPEAMDPAVVPGGAGTTGG